MLRAQREDGGDADERMHAARGQLVGIPVGGGCNERGRAFFRANEALKKEATQYIVDFRVAGGRKRIRKLGGNPIPFHKIFPIISLNNANEDPTLGFLFITISIIS